LWVVSNSCTDFKQQVEEEGGWGESKSDGLHVMHPAAAAACRFVERPHFQATRTCHAGRSLPVHCARFAAFCRPTRNRRAMEGIASLNVCAGPIAVSSQALTPLPRAPVEALLHWKLFIRCRSLRLLKMVEDGLHECTRERGGACIDEATRDGDTGPRMHREPVTSPVGCSTFCGIRLRLLEVVEDGRIAAPERAARYTHP
jgi:hypothetical protein